MLCLQRSIPGRECGKLRWAHCARNSSGGLCATSAGTLSDKCECCVVLVIRDYQYRGETDESARNENNRNNSELLECFVGLSLDIENIDVYISSVALFFGS